MNYESYIEKLMQHYTSAPYMPEVRAAKEDFFERAGTFDEASLDFELKMAQFTDWYLFIRKMDKTVPGSREIQIDSRVFYTEIHL